MPADALPWMDVAKRNVGLHELLGPRSEPRILAMARKLGRALGIAYADDAVPWCGVFVGYCMSAVPNAILPSIAVRAKSWAFWGFGLNHPVYGAVCVFERPGGGHVGFYVGERLRRDGGIDYRILGGNQSDAVGYAWIAAERCIAVRWPHQWPLDPHAKPITLADDGAAISKNEA